VCFVRRLAAAVVVLGALAAIACAPDAPPAGQHAPAPAIQDGRAAQVGPPAIPGVDGPPGTTAVDTPTPPWAGPEAITRSTAAIMAQADRSAQVADPEPRRFVKVRPDRHALPSHPEARPVGSWPPRPLFDRDPTGPSVAQTLASPNVTVASLGEQTNALPPDTMGDIGPTQYLVGVNGRIRTIAKASGLADGVLNVSFDSFFAGVRNGASTSDPRVRFDRRTGRWIVIMISVALPNRYLVAVSDTPTITAGTIWTYFHWTNTRTQGGVGGGASCLGDYPSLGVDEDALYIGVNQFCGANIAGLTFDSASIYVVRKSLLLSGSLSVAQFDGVTVSGGAGPYTPQGVDNFDNGTNEGYVIGVDNAAFGQLTLRRVSNPAGAPSLSANVAIVLPTATTLPIAVPHLGGVVPLDAIDDRLLQAVMRNGRLWTTHQIEVNGSGAAQGGGGRNGVRWYELQNLATTPSLVQSGTVFDPSGSTPVSFWFGAIMPSGQGHVALGMTIAGAATRVNAAVTGRLASDPLGTMNGAPVIYSPNTSFAYNVQGSPATRQRWGDYSYTSVDPDDDMTLWTVQEYVDANDSYGVRLVRLLAPPPATPMSVAPNTLLPTQAGATLTVTAASASGSGFFDPGAGFIRRLTAGFSGAGVTVTNVAVTSPTTLTLTVSTNNAATGPRTLTITNPDGQTTQLASAVTIGSGVNNPPSAAADGRTTPFGAVLNVPAPGVLANDTDPEGQPLTAQLVSPAANGTVTLNGNGSFLYVPAGGFSGSDGFTYRAFDGAQLSNVATVSITVGANRAPVFGVVPANQTLFHAGTGTSSGPLAFTVSDPDGSAVAVSATSSNTAVITASGIALAGSGSSRTITLSTAGATTLGTTTITLTASDGFVSTVASFTVTVQASVAPGAPRTLTATTSRNSVVFGWQPPLTSEPVLAYLLEAGHSPGATAITVPLGQVLAFAATAIDGVYFVRVRAITAAGSGPASNEVQIALGQAAPPMSPQALLATVQGTMVTLQWTENAFGPVITAYQVHAGSATGLANIGVLALAPSARTFSVAAPAGTYFVRLVAVNAAGASAPSNEAVVVTGAGICTVPAAPTGLQASATAGVINVRWNPASAGAIPLAYVLRAGSVSGAADRGIFTFPAAVTAVGGAVPPGPYFIQVAATNPCGISAPAVEVSSVVP
jgi:hypothetical protein